MMEKNEKNRYKIRIFLVLIFLIFSIFKLSTIFTSIGFTFSDSSYVNRDSSYVNRDSSYINHDSSYINHDSSYVNHDSSYVKSSIKDTIVMNKTEITTSLSSPKIVFEKIEKIPSSNSLVFAPKLWDYSIRCDFSGFAGVCNPKSYIMPDNEVINYISSLMYLNDGALYWKNNYFNETGIFSGEFILDKNQFNNKDDYWINPDYYFMNGMRGDCEDMSVAVASILENKGVRTKVIGGWITQDNIRSRDWIVEYKIGPVYYRYYGGVFNLGFTPRGMFELHKQEYDINFEPVLMFDKNSYYEPYNSNW